jgi:benzylsuccinate synthase
MRGSRISKGTKTIQSGELKKKILQIKIKEAIMSVCKDCKSFFPYDDNPQKGDCVRKVTDERQTYYSAKPTDAAHDATQCKFMQKK